MQGLRTASWWMGYVRLIDSDCYLNWRGILNRMTKSKAIRPIAEDIIQKNDDGENIRLTRTKKGNRLKSHMRLILKLLYCDAVKCEAVKLARKIPVISMWTTDDLENREMEEIIYGGFGLGKVVEDEEGPSTRFNTIENRQQELNRTNLHCMKYKPSLHEPYKPSFHKVQTFIA
ncbi:hypothetical protein L1887_17717 [Cichorium endivia]|nr:hypothetical protein L1887_17717 [Cichorium endivia]